jgi:hypothetical protein
MLGKALGKIRPGLRLREWRWSGAELFGGPLRLVVAWTSLNVWLNVRFPGHEQPFSWLLPSLDATLLLVVLAGFGWRRRAVPRWFRSGALAMLFCARLLRFGDGIEGHFFHRTFNFYLDFRLVPDLFRLVMTTVAPWQWGLAALGLSLGLIAGVGLLRWSLSTAERQLRSSTGRGVLFALLAVAMVASPWLPASKQHTNVGAFETSIASRVVDEIDFVLHVDGQRDARLAAIRRAERRLDHTPVGFEGLHSADVLLFIVESYGSVVFSDPEMARSAVPASDRFVRSLESHGFHVRSAALDSPTFGGRSWLAHATLATGAWVNDEFIHQLLFTTGLRPLASFFHDAGYRTVLVEPGTTTLAPHDDFFGFDQHYYAKDFDYRGPALGWARLPDQYVVDFVRRSELQGAGRPRFIEFALVSSHAPWAAVPPLIEDPRAIGNGAAYAQRAPQRFATELADLDHAQHAYLASILYDLEVLRRFVTESVHGDSLIIVLGDHQPALAATDPNGAKERVSRAVPVHVISRNERLLAPFAALGYDEGMIAKSPRAHFRMDDLFFQLVSSYAAAGGRAELDRAVHARPALPRSAR